MPPLSNSRYLFSQGVTDADDNLYLTEREPFLYQTFSDNRYHRVAEGDTLHSLAERYLDGLPNPERLWWILADFQPERILDPTITLALGRVIVLPSLKVVKERIFDETRRQE